jgi:hypothetical protein
VTKIGRITTTVIGRSARERGGDLVALARVNATLGASSSSSPWPATRRGSAAPPSAGDNRILGALVAGGNRSVTAAPHPPAVDISAVYHRFVAGGRTEIVAAVTVLMTASNAL